MVGVAFLETELRQGIKQQQDLKPLDQHQVYVASSLPSSTRGGLSKVLQAPGVRSVALELLRYYNTGVNTGKVRGQETVCSICSNLAGTFLLALGSLGRQSCGQEILFMP